MNSQLSTVYIYEGEATFLSRLTLQYPNVETGGDLFGLWRNESEVVIHAVLGPGRNCRRTGVSFFQDAEYLKRNGDLLTKREGLCHIGSWHSHHRMNLPRPSQGDERTVWQNLSRPGRFLVLIATITPSVQMSFFLFDSIVEKQIGMNCSILDGESPIRANSAFSRQVLTGAEIGSFVLGEMKASECLEGQQEQEREKCRAKAKHRASMHFLPRNVLPGRGEARRIEEAQRHGMQRMKEMTCDGTGTYRRYEDRRHWTIQCEVFVQWRRNRGREMLFHDNHPVGHCRVCRDIAVRDSFCAIL